MDWIDTTMLAGKRLESGVGSRMPEKADRVKVTSALSARVIAVQGVSVLYVRETSREGINAAIHVLREFRATGRRVVLCDTSHTVAGRPLGRELVETGAATTVVSCGTYGRDLAIGARDAGLDLSSVVVCRSALAACELLSFRLLPGDTVLVWGVEQSVCDRLIANLNNRLGPQVASSVNRETS